MRSLRKSLKRRTCAPWMKAYVATLPLPIRLPNPGGIRQLLEPVFRSSSASFASLSVSSPCDPPRENPAPPNVPPIHPPDEGGDGEVDDDGYVLPFWFCLQIGNENIPLETDSVPWHHYMASYLKEGAPTPPPPMSIVGSVRSNIRFPKMRMNG